MNIPEDIFVEVCRHLKFWDILELQLLSKNTRWLIQKSKWTHTSIILHNMLDINEKITYLVSNFNFACYDLSQCNMLTNKSIIFLCTFKSLHILDLSHNNTVTDELIKSLCEVYETYRYSINSLSLSNNKKITYASIFSLANAISNNHHFLHDLDISYCSNIMDSSIRTLGEAITLHHNKNMKSLHALNLCGCLQLTSWSIITLIHIHTLNLYGLFKVSFRTYEILRNNGVNIIYKDSSQLV